MSELRWAIVSGEFPPAHGGVADYTAQLAMALAAAGDRVHVFAPAPLDPVPGCKVHPLPGRFARTARRQLDQVLREAERQGAGLQMLVQYVPHAYGARAMNVGFTGWVARQRRRKPWVMFHEVAVDWEPGQRWRRHLFAAVTRHMARQLLHASERSFASIPAWVERLHSLDPDAPSTAWMPVPSNMPVTVPAESAAAARALWARPNGLLIGTLGGDAFSQRELPRVLADVLALRPDCRWIGIGPGSEGFRAALAAARPAIAAQLGATGYLNPASAAALLSALDVQVQLYGDGISTRRGSAMAALGLGKCLATHAGHNSEAFWETSPAITLASLRELAPAVVTLLDDPARRQRQGEAARRLYDERFAIRHTVAQLRTIAGGTR